jgi:four helix bundle protein
MSNNIRHFRELDVYRLAMDAAMEIFELTKAFPAGERYSLTDQIRRSSRSVCANLAEAWRKRRYPQAFVSKLSDSEAEAAETQVWLEMAVRCGYLNKAHAQILDQHYDNILGKLVVMMSHPDERSIRTINEESPEYA